MPGTVLALVRKMSAGAVSPQGVYSLVGKSEQMMTNISCHVSAVGCVAGRLNLVWNGISKAYGGSDSWGVSEEDSSIRGGERGWHSGHREWCMGGRKEHGALKRNNNQNPGWRPGLGQAEWGEEWYKMGLKKQAGARFWGLKSQQQ